MARPTQDELYAILTKKGAASNCEICGKNEWAVPARPDGQAEMFNFFAAQPGAALTVGGRTIPAFMNVCTNCGNIRLHAVGMVALGSA